MPAQSAHSVSHFSWIIQPAINGRDDLADRHDGLGETDDEALLIAVRTLRDETRECRTQTSAADGRESEHDQQLGNGLRKSDGDVGERGGHEADANDHGFAQSLDRTTDEAALHQRSENADKGKDIRDFANADDMALPDVAAFGEKGKAAHEGGEGEGEEHPLREQASEVGAAEIGNVCAPGEQRQATGIRFSGSMCSRAISRTGNRNSVPMMLMNDRPAAAKIGAP